MRNGSPSQAPMASPQDNDPLDGFRGREMQAGDALIEEVLAYRELAATDLDKTLLALVLKRDQLERALQNESGSMVALVNMVLAKLDDACKVWQQEGDPTSVAARTAHLNARAARLVIDWVQEVMDQGQQAQDMMMMQEEEEGDLHE